MELCTYDRIHVAGLAVANEFGIKDFHYIETDKKEYQEARYHFVYFCFTRLNARPKMIRQFLPCYKYPKTVYQVIRRQYQRRKKREESSTQNAIQMWYNELLNKYEPICTPIKCGKGKQQKLF